MTNYLFFSVPVYALIESFLLVFIRLIGFFAVVPIFGGTTNPTISKLSVAYITAGLIIIHKNVSVSVLDSNLLSFAGMAIKEAFVGILLGFTVYMLFAMFYFVGQVVDFQIGFSMVSVFDPINQMQVPITGNIMYLTLCVMLIVTNAYQNLFRAVFFSFDVIPIGTSIILNTNVFDAFLILLTTFFVTGFQLTLPIVGSLFILQVALGMLTKTAPQMNIFSVGMPIKLLCGLTILYLIMPLFINISDMVFSEMNQAMLRMIEGMAP